MNTIFAYPAAAHDNKISGLGLLFMAGSAVNGCRHDAKCCYKHKAFAHVAVIEQGLTKGCRHTALVAAVFYPFHHTIQQTPWMLRCFQRAFVVNVSDTEAVASHDQPGAKSRSKGVPINSHNSGNGTAIGFHVGGRVMGFTCDDIIVVFIKPPDTGIVPQHRYNPVFFIFELQGWFLDIGFKKVCFNALLTG